MDKGTGIGVYTNTAKPYTTAISAFRLRLTLQKS